MTEKLRRRGYTVRRYEYTEGTVFPPHSHEVDKIDAVLAGRFRLEMEGEMVVLGPGDCIAIPKGLVHSAAVLGGETVISLDAIRENSF